MCLNYLSIYNRETCHTKKIILTTHFEFIMWKLLKYDSCHIFKLQHLLLIARRLDITLLWSTKSIHKIFVPFYFLFMSSYIWIFTCARILRHKYFSSALVVWNKVYFEFSRKKRDLCWMEAKHFSVEIKEKENPLRPWRNFVCLWANQISLTLYCSFENNSREGGG